MISIRLFRQFSTINFKEKAVVKHNELAKEMLDSLTAIHKNTKIPLTDALNAYKKVSENLWYRSINDSASLRVGIWDVTHQTSYIPLRRTIGILDDELRQKLDVEIDIMLINLLKLIDIIDQIKPKVDSISTNKEKFDLYLMFQAATRKLFVYELIGLKSKAVTIYKAYWESFNKNIQNFDISVKRNEVEFVAAPLLLLLEYALNNNTIHIKELNEELQKLLDKFGSENIHSKIRFYCTIKKIMENLVWVKTLYYQKLTQHCENYILEDFNLYEMSIDETKLYFYSMESILTSYDIYHYKNQLLNKYINHVLPNQIKKYPDFTSKFYELLLSIFNRFKFSSVMNLNPEIYNFSLNQLQIFFHISGKNRVDMIMRLIECLAQQNMGTSPDARFNTILNYIRYFNENASFILEKPNFLFEYSIKIRYLFVKYFLDTINHNNDDLSVEARFQIAYLSKKCIFGSIGDSIKLITRLYIFNTIQRKTELGNHLPENAMHFTKFTQTFYDNISLINSGSILNIISALKFANAQVMEQFVLLIHTNNYFLLSSYSHFITNLAFWQNLIISNHKLLVKSDALQLKFQEFIDFYTQEFKTNKANMFFNIETFDPDKVIHYKLNFLYKMIKNMGVINISNDTDNDESQKVDKLLELCFEILFIEMEKNITNLTVNYFAKVKNTNIDIYLMIHVINMISAKKDFMNRSKNFIFSLFKLRVSEIINEPDFTMLKNIYDMVFTVSYFPSELKEWLIKISYNPFEFVNHKIDIDSFESYMFAEEILEFLWTHLWYSTREFNDNRFNNNLMIFKQALRIFYTSSSDDINIDKKVDYITKYVYLSPIPDFDIVNSIEKVIQDYWNYYFSFKNEFERDNELYYIEVKLFYILRKLFAKESKEIDYMKENHKELLLYLTNKFRKLDESIAIVYYKPHEEKNQEYSNFILLQLLMKTGLQFTRKNFCGLYCDFYLENSKTFIKLLNNNEFNQPKDYWVFQQLAEIHGVKLLTINMRNTSTYLDDMIYYIQEELKLRDN